MDLQNAIDKAQQILDQERAEPTISYSQMFTREIASAMGTLALASTRGAHHIREDPRSCLFQSANFDLLSVLLDQVPQAERPAFFGVLRSRILDDKAFRHKYRDVLSAGSWKQCSSELPLIAEFLTRRGDKQLLIGALSEAPVGPGQTLLLVQVQEIIALNFTLFREDEYPLLLAAIESIHRTVEQRAGQRKRSQDTVESNSIYHACREMPEVCVHIKETCRKARYLYVKSELSLDTNLEINQDENAVRSFLEDLGFSHLLVQSLNEMERSYRAAATPFELKSSMSHLRSFLEGVHLEACSAANKKFGGSIPAKWGDSLPYLRDHGVLTLKEEHLVSALYTLMSDTAVHPLIAEREYARLMRNMSIEYGLLLLTKLNKLGLK